MKLSKLVSVIGLFLWGTVAMGQSIPLPAPTNSISLNAYAVAVPGLGKTVAGTLAEAEWNITPTFNLRGTGLVSGALTGEFGGFDYQLPKLSTGLNNISPYLNGKQFRFYLTGNVGSSQFENKQHIGFLAGGGVRYDPTNSGKFTVTLVEVQYAKLPDYANNTAIIAAGVGTTPGAVASVTVKPVMKVIKKVF